MTRRVCGCSAEQEPNSICYSTILEDDGLKKKIIIKEGGGGLPMPHSVDLWGRTQHISFQLKDNFSNDGYFNSVTSVTD